MRNIIWLLTGIVVLAGSWGASRCHGQETAPGELSFQEKQFVEQLTSAVLAGSFTIDGRETPPKPERYTINGVTKVEGANWVVSARIKYGEHDVTVPVPVEVRWAGDTPMIQVTDLSIPGLGDEFSARVLFYQGRYAGTWSHGKVGGTMFGRIEKSSPPKSGD